MIHQSWEPEHGPAHDVRALLRELPDLSGVTPWGDAFASAPPAEPPVEPPTEPPAFVPLPEVAPLVEVEPLVPAPPAPPAAPEPVEQPAAAPRLYVASSWDSLGGAEQQSALPQPYVEPAPALEGKKATEVLAELGFLDD